MDAHSAFGSCTGCGLCREDLAQLEAAALEAQRALIPQLKLEIVTLQRAARGVKSAIVRRRCVNDAAAKQDHLDSILFLVALHEPQNS